MFSKIYPWNHLILSFSVQGGFWLLLFLFSSPFFLSVQSISLFLFSFCKFYISRKLSINSKVSNLYTIFHDSLLWSFLFLKCPLFGFTWAFWIWISISLPRFGSLQPLFLAVNIFYFFTPFFVFFWRSCNTYIALLGEAP